MIRRRRMVRNFDSRPLPPELAERVVANALRGPSAGFTQGTEVLVLQGIDQTSRYWDTCFPAAGRPGSAGRGSSGPAPARLLRQRRGLLRPLFGAGQGQHWRKPGGQGSVAVAGRLLGRRCRLRLDAGPADSGGRRPRRPVLRRLPPRRARAEFGIPDRFTPVGTVAVGFPLPHEPSRSLARGRRPQSEVVHRGAW